MQRAVALLVPVGVVDLLEAVEVEEDECDAVVVTGRSLQLQLELPDEGLVVQKPGELVVTRLVGELRRRAIEVRHDAFRDELVDRVVEPPLTREHVLAVQLGCALGDEAPQDAAQDQELGHDLAGGEAEGFALACMVASLRCERAPAPEALGLRVDQLPRELDDERRHVSELPESPEALERRDLIVEEPLFHDRDGQVPGRRVDRGGELLERGYRCARAHHSP